MPHIETSTPPPAVAEPYRRVDTRLSLWFVHAVRTFSGSRHGNCALLIGFLPTVVLSPVSGIRCIFYFLLCGEEIARADFRCIPSFFHLNVYIKNPKICSCNQKVCRKNHHIQTINSLYQSTIFIVFQDKKSQNKYKKNQLERQIPLR